MILHDKVSVLQRAIVGYDKYGDALYGNVQVPHRAEVRPLASTENVTAGAQVTTRFRIFLGPRADDVTPADALTWRGRDYEIEGAVEPHSDHGRLHHFEAVVKRVTG